MTPAESGLSSACLKCSVYPEAAQVIEYTSQLAKVDMPVAVLSAFSLQRESWVRLTRSYHHT